MAFELCCALKYSQQANYAEMGIPYPPAQAAKLHAIIAPPPHAVSMQAYAALANQPQHRPSHPQQAAPQQPYNPAQTAQHQQSSSISARKVMPAPPVFKRRDAPLPEGILELAVRATLHTDPYAASLFDWPCVPAGYGSQADEFLVLLGMQSSRDVIETKEVCASCCRLLFVLMLHDRRSQKCPRNARASSPPLRLPLSTHATR